jgi:hypothetical protein
MNGAGKITLLLCLLLLNILIWFVLLPNEKKSLQNNLFTIQLENMDAYFTNHYMVNSSYIGADNFFNIDEDYYLEIKKDYYCIVDLNANLCIDSTKHEVIKTKNCVTGKCQ